MFETILFQNRLDLIGARAGYHLELQIRENGLLGFGPIDIVRRIVGVPECCFGFGASELRNCFQVFHRLAPQGKGNEQCLTLFQGNSKPVSLPDFSVSFMNS